MIKGRAYEPLRNKLTLYRLILFLTSSMYWKPLVTNSDRMQISYFKVFKTTNVKVVESREN